MLKAAQVFALPEGGVLFERDRLRYEPIKFQLPYKHVALEYHVDPSRPIDGECSLEKRLLLLWQNDEEAFKHFIEDIRYFKLDKDYIEEIREKAIFCLLMTEFDGVWSGIEFGALMPLKNLDSKFTREANDLGEKKGNSPSPWGIQPLLYFSGKATRYLSSNRLTLDNYFEAIVSGLNYEAEVVWQFLSALECRNVRVDDIPPPSRLQAKRLRDKKVPLISYKVLTLDVEPHIVRPAGSGHHAPPRTHLRRGHIRRLPTHTVWVNATVVRGSAGLVLKDYSVAA